ncbi:MAG: hypothetical protein ABIJ57_05325, partial [Pseudomonadota bacterium]
LISRAASWRTYEMKAVTQTDRPQSLTSINNKYLTWSVSSIGEISKCRKGSFCIRSVWGMLWGDYRENK